MGRGHGSHGRCHGLSGLDSILPGIKGGVAQHRFTAGGFSVTATEISRLPPSPLCAAGEWILHILSGDYVGEADPAGFCEIPRVKQNVDPLPVPADSTQILPP